jgi:hypothetical protein
MKHIFQVPIGDWSGDGHGRCEWFTVRSDQPVEAWREAYLTSQAQWPELAPDGELSRTPTSGWPLDRIREQMAERLDARLYTELADGTPSSHDILLYTMAFCQLSDPSLSWEHEPMQMLPFYGQDSQGRHIDRIGYELWM